ncbi:hypothetical protein IJ23_10625 [Vibrio sp. OY15]|nr:hypothetical protein IJ23_10625 [Vibrio sp. OY15]NYU20642.1 hypothetical protein [Vibrio parahaemolyticus]
MMAVTSYITLYFTLLKGKKERFIYGLISITLITVSSMFNIREPHLFDVLSSVIIYVLSKWVKTDPKYFLLTVTAIYWLYPLVLSVATLQSS